MKCGAQGQGLDDAPLGGVELVEAGVDFLFFEIMEGHFDEDVAMLGFRGPKPVVEFLQGVVVFDGDPDDAETFGATALDDGGKEQAVEKTVERIGATEIEE